MSGDDVTDSGIRIECHDIIPLFHLQMLAVAV